MDFRRVIYENTKQQKKKYSLHNKHLYIRVTVILKFHEVLFCTYCKGLLCL